jgi:hypothetical protein
MLAAASALSAQQVGSNAAPGQSGAFTVKVNSQVVVETVVVRDKQGSLVHGLGAKNFTITEHGVPQTIKIFEQQSHPDRFCLRDQGRIQRRDHVQLARLGQHQAQRPNRRRSRAPAGRI